MKPFAIVSKPRHPLAEPLIRDASRFLLRNKLPFIVDKETFENYSETLKEYSVPVVERSALSNMAKAIIVLGGDGTLISVCRHPSDEPPDIIGINLGTLGFLTEITSDEMIPSLEAYLSDSVRFDTRTLLKVEVQESDKRYHFYSLNDVVISKQALARIFALRLRVAGDDATLIRGDGLIISSPSGSTAYSLAAGGSIVHPDVDALLVTPICPHSLTSRPLVVPGSTLLEMEVGPDCKADSVYLTVDGQEGLVLHEGAKVKVAKSHYTVRFMKSNSKSYFDILTNKLRWGLS